MTVISAIFQLIGSLGLLLYGMKMMSDGVQKSAGQSLHRILGLMTSNRFFAMLTGMCVTMIIQSSGATTVMVVSFVNAGLMTLTQSIGVIFGANIGTTITAWIVAIFGFKFNISAVAIPIFGIGFFLTTLKKFKKHNVGEALMGFGMLFLGLDMLSNAIPTMDATSVSFLGIFTDKGFLGIIVGVVAGILITVLLHSSSASTAIILTLSFNRILTWEFAAAMVLGSNIGSTIDAILASIGSKVNARRTALVHVLFNISGTILALFFFKPLLALVDIIVPGDVYDSITINIATLHTIFNLICTCLFLPFTTQIAHLTEKIIKPKKDETPDTYKLEFIESGMKENTEAYLIRAEKEISDMTGIAFGMFKKIRSCLLDKEQTNITEMVEPLAKTEDYADQMQEQLSRFLVQCSQLPVNEIQRNNISLQLRIVDDLESLTDDCYSIILLLQRSIDKNMTFADEDMDRLQPYINLADQFLEFICAHMNKSLNAEELKIASDLENQIDLFRKNLKKVARKRLESGADVKTELLYIDLVRNIEKIGDRAFSISEALSQTK